MRFTVDLGTSKWGVDRPWVGDRYKGKHETAIAFDTETEVVEDRLTIPRLALWTASTGSKSCIGRPDQLADFLLAHKDQHLVAFNTKFDFEVCDQYLRTECKGEWAAKAIDALWTMMDEGRFHDAMLLDQLLRLAEGRIDFSGPDADEASVWPRDLGTCLREYCGIALDKTDPYRKRFGELIGRDWADSTIEPGFWSYAAKDTIATSFLWQKLVARSKSLLKRARKVYPGHIDEGVEDRWGYFTESLQARATVALADISRRGISFDREAAAVAEANDRNKLDNYARTLYTLEPALFKYTTDPRKPDAPGQTYFPGFEPVSRFEDIARSPKSGGPCFKAKPLAKYLTSLANRLGLSIPRSEGKKKLVSKSAKAWADDADRDIWLKAWCESVKLTTQMKFYNLFKGEANAIHTRFNPLLMTGRVSASKPSVHQCCSADTELLTDRGWVKFGDITEDDVPERVAQFDPESRTISFVEPDQWIEQEWSKPLVHVSNSNVDFCVTHDHRCLVEDREGGLEVVEAREVEGDVAILHGGNYEGGEGEINLDFLRFVIAFQADGTWNEQGNLAFHLKRDDKLGSLRECLKALGVDFTDKGNPNSGTVHIVIEDEYLVEATYSALGPDKLFGPWLLDIQREAIDFFVDEIWLWDGDSDRLTGYTSEHLHNANWVQIMCLLSGRRAQVRHYENNGGQHAYVVDHSADEVSSYITHAETSTEDANGKVYCVSVPKGFIVTRRDGKVAVTGNCPRDGEFRKLFVARPGYKLLTADFSAIELVTFAAIARARFGYSKLGDVIDQHKDAHCFTASLLIKETYENVVEQVKKEKQQAKEAKAKGLPTPPAPYSGHRQTSKCCSFGIIGGLGGPKLSVYAKANYQVDMSIEMACALREKITRDVYPEMGEYLEDDSIRSIQWTLGVAPKAISFCFNIGDISDKEEVGRTMRSASKVLRGKAFKANGAPYKEGYVARMWAALLQLANHSKSISVKDRERIEKKQPSPALERKIFGGPAITTTGRIRAGCTYTQARNTPFQGLAADGMKLAIWRLCKLGHRVVNTIHDEVVVELPEATAEEDAKVIERVLCDSMSEVIGKRLPVGVETNLAPYWAKA